MTSLQSQELLDTIKKELLSIEQAHEMLSGIITPYSPLLHARILDLMESPNFRNCDISPNSRNLQTAESENKRLLEIVDTCNKALRLQYDYTIGLETRLAAMGKHLDHLISHTD